MSEWNSMVIGTHGSSILMVGTTCFLHYNDWDPALEMCFPIVPCSIDKR